MKRERGGADRSELTRAAFREACGSAEPDLRRIKDAFPGLVAEAARIRAAAARPDTMTSVGLLAGRLLPKLAAIAALLVLAGAVVGLREDTVTRTADVEVDTLILTGEVGGTASDLLLRAVAEGETNNG